MSRRIAEPGWWTRWTIGSGGFIGEVMLVSVKEDYPDLDITPRCALLTEFYVHPLRRGRGWAKELMQTAFKYADSKGLDLVTFAQPYGVQSMSKEELQSFYLKMGFEFVDDGENMVRYAKT